MLEHVSSSAGAKFDELVTQFIEAKLRFGHLVLVVEPNANHQWARVEDGKYATTVRVPWLGDRIPGRYVLAPQDEGMDGPLATFKRLARQAWAWLPVRLKEQLILLDDNLNLLASDEEWWVWFLWRESHWSLSTPEEECPTDGPPLIPPECDLLAFDDSVELIRKLQLNTATPTVPSWLPIASDQQHENRPKSVRGRPVESETQELRELIAARWREFRSDYKMLGHSSGNWETFAIWAREQDDLPEWDAKRFKREYGAFKKTPKPKRQL